MTIAETAAQRRPAPSFAACAAATASIIVTGAVWHVRSYANTDIAWLLTVGEHILDGAVPYRDIIETNPPGSVLLYLPAVLIGRATGIEPQTIVMLLTALACAASLALCCLIVREGRQVPGQACGPLLASVAAILVLLPTGSFGQREHIVLLATLPLLCVVAVRQQACQHVSLPLSLLSVAGAGIAVAIKPYDALGLIGPALLLGRRTGWRSLAGAWELWLSGVVAASLMAAQLAEFPSFTHDVLPLLTRVYLPMRQPLSLLVSLSGGSFGIATLLGAMLVRYRWPPTNRERLPDTAALAAVGFLAAYLVQGKGWPYQAYPAIATALIAIAAVLAGSAMRPSGPRESKRTTLWVYGTGACLLAGGAAVGFDAHLDIDREAPGLVQAVESLGPNPRMMSLASDIAVGHPLVRQVGGRWVGTLMASWIDLYIARIAPGVGRAGPLGPDLAFEDRVMASDIRDRRPDAVLASVPGWTEWIGSEPLVHEALADYRLTGTFGSVMLWTRRAGLRGTSDLGRRATSG